MAPIVVQGSRGSSVQSTEDRAVRDVAASMFELEPSAGPLTTIMMKIGSTSAHKPEFEWYEDELVPRFDKLGGSLTSSATTMTVANFKYFKNGHLVKIENQEIVRVTATPTTSTVTIVRAFGTTAARAATSSTGQLHIVGSAFEQGSVKSDMISTQKVQKTNFAQIHKTAWGQTNTEKHTTQHAGQDKTNEKSKNLIEHKRGIELASWHGEKKKVSTGTHDVLSSAGILSYIDTNIKDVGGELTEAEFEDWLRLCFRYGSDEKFVFCSPKAIGVINSFSRGKLQTRTDESTYGVTMTKYQNAGRNVALIENKLFTNDSLNDLTEIAGYAVCLDLQDLKLRFMRGTVVSLEQNIQVPGQDEMISQYVSELGLQMSLEKKHGLMTGIES